MQKIICFSRGTRNTHSCLDCQNARSEDVMKEYIYNLTPTTNMEELAKYHHQSVCSPPKSSFLRAISNKQFKSFPGLTYQLISKHLPPSTATDKGHMIRQRSDVQSTRHNRQDILDARQAVDDLNPPQQLCTALEDCMYCFAVLGDRSSGIIYTDLCGRFPVTSFRGMKYIFVAYVYKCNSILMRPMKGRPDKDMVKAFQDIYGYLREQNLTPAFTRWLCGSTS